MKSVLCRGSLLLALAFGISLVGFGAVADAGGPRYSSGCQPGTHYGVQYQPVSYPYQPMTYRSVPCQTVTYRSVPCQTVTYRSVPCQTVTYRTVPCPPVQCAPPPCIPSGPPTEPTPKEPPPSGVLLEVVDLVDPLEVDSEGTYVITVTNQGTQAINNIQITATLPEQLQYLSSEGPTEASAEGQVIRFTPLKTLNAEDEVEYRLKAKAVGVGDIRFQLELTTDQSPEPIRETESTNLYE